MTLFLYYAAIAAIVSQYGHLSLDLFLTSKPVALSTILDANGHILMLRC